MTTRRRVLLGLAGLSAPGAPWAQPLPKPPAQPKPPSGKTAKPASRAAPPAGKAPPRKPPATRAGPVPPPQDRAAKRGAERPDKPEAATAPSPRPPIPARDDGPSLRPLDRELVRQWVAASPDWRPSGQPLSVGQGQPLPPSLPRRPPPPELAVLLPYFPGYRYAAMGPDLVLYANGTEVVASLLPGVLAR